MPEAAYGLIVSMQPQQPYYQPVPPQQPQQPANPYEFITNSGRPPKKSLLPSSNSMAQRILIVVGGLFVFVIVVVIFINLVFGSGNSSSAGLVSLAQQQNELIRVAGIGTQQAQAQATKDFATSAQLSVLSEQQQLLSFLQQNGVKIDPKELALGHNAQTDTAINSAVAASNFDSTFKPIMQSQLQKYLLSLKQAYAKTKNTREQQLLSNDYNDAQLLLEQLKQTS